MGESDVVGLAGSDYYYNNKRGGVINVTSDIAEDDIIDVEYLFREYHQMPLIEQIAVEKCSGRVLDIGAGMGSHSLALQRMNKDVTALEISKAACNIMQNRGVKKVLHHNFFEPESFNQPHYDTLLLLMNGIGIVGTVDNLKSFFSIAKKLLSPRGKIIFDSSDISYLFADQDGSILVNLNDKYYGEMIYQMSYNTVKGEPFPWLFIDYHTLEYYALQHNFKVELLYSDGHFQYLAQLTPIKK
ncbi:class I SAM-dependent methyltransferase [Marinilabiliaceae bacterium ANBcel2]|nr:class I SAM-dependent methyltransferase [Marinilabiliaceae bacterium ANBcel2]